MMQNYIDILRQLNYELVKELGLFKHRAGLSFSQRHILYHIKNNISLSIQELADFLHVEHSTMSRNIKKLVQSGLVDIYQDEKDKRRKVITLSAAGESRLAEATDSINETISKILEVLDDEEIEIVIHGIHRYCEALKLIIRRFIRINDENPRNNPIKKQNNFPIRECYKIMLFN